MSKEIYSEMFWLSLGGLIFGFLGLTIRYCLKSKCDSVECGCIKIHRAVDVEERIEERNIDLGITDSSNK